MVSAGEVCEGEDVIVGGGGGGGEGAFESAISLYHALAAVVL